ncbi:helicase-associated domain-containing protein [Spirillospora sp. NPDC052242]
MTGAPLPEWLAALGRDALAEVLAARADACGPPEPGGWDDLAGRLQDERSVERALRRLTRPCVQVAEAAAVLGRDATRASITALLGGPAAAVDDALATLERHALAWPGRDGTLHVVEALRERWPEHDAAAGRMPFDPVPPGPPTVPVDPERVERTAAARLGEFAGHLAGTLAECARRPLQTFKRAGAQPRALQRVMAAARCDEASARLALACARGAGLLAGDGAHLRLSPEGDAFTYLPPGEQAARALLAWWTLPSSPTRTRSDDGGQLYPLSTKADCDGCVQVRRELVTVLREVPGGRGLQAPEDLGRTLDWHRPLACDHGPRHPPHGALLHEAVLLGLVAHGALSSFGALLAAGDRAGLARRASERLPPFSGRATIAPDLTVTVRGTPSRPLARELDAAAESLVGPSWRISDGSLRRALESGLSPADIEARLTAVSRAPLPPALRRKIAAAADGRVPPRLREVPATCVFQSADADLVARAVRHPALRALGVRLLSPGVLIAPAPRESVLAALRAAGFAVAEDPAPGPLPPPAADEPPPDVGALAERLRKEPRVPPRSPARPRAAAPRPSRRRSTLERAERVITREARELGSDEVRLLARAVAEDGRVRITYVDLNGEETSRVIAPPYEMVRLNRRKLLKAVCEMRSAEAGRPEERHFDYSRIQSVEAVNG